MSRVPLVRTQPPLNIERELFEQGLDVLEEAIREVSRARSLS
jgi:4-aminobutyrate aminotransferase-like enzyme